MLYWFARDAITKFHSLGALAKSYFLVVLGASLVESRYQQLWFLLGPLSLVCRWPPSLWLCPPVIFPPPPPTSLMSLCVLISFSYKDTSQIGYKGLIFTQSRF